MITVVIPVWNGRGLLEKSMPAVVAAMEEPRNRILEMIAVDDASSDDSVKYLQKEWGGKVRLIRHRENRGFSSAVNMGVRMAKGELVCLLNQDVSPSRDFLKSILPHFKNSCVFGVSLHEKGYGPAGGKFKGGFIEHWGGPEEEKVQESFWASGGSGVFRRKVWMKLKGFDEELLNPFYWEDTDLCYRAQKRGYVVLWEPKAKVVHEHESVINENNFQRRRLGIIKERNQLLFIWKNVTSRRLIRKHYAGLLKRVLRHPGYVVVVVAALRKVGVVRRLRKIEVRETTVSDEAILARFKK